MLKQMGLHKVAYFYAGAFALALVIGYLGGIPNIITRHPLTLTDVLVRLALGVVAGLAVAGAWVALKRVWTGFDHVDQQLARMVGPLTVSEGLLLAGLSGLGEEALFRGAIQPLAGITVASILFMLAHLPPTPRLWPWTISAGVMGLMFGVATHLTQDILLAVSAHATINAVGFIRMGGNPAEENRSSPWP